VESTLVLQLFQVEIFYWNDRKSMSCRKHAGSRNFFMMVIMSPHTSTSIKLIRIVIWSTRDIDSCLAVYESGLAVRVRIYRVIAFINSETWIYNLDEVPFQPLALINPAFDVIKTKQEINRRFFSVKNRHMSFTSNFQSSFKWDELNS
jgi:hypothetical protein